MASSPAGGDLFSGKAGATDCAARRVAGTADGAQGCGRRHRRGRRGALALAPRRAPRGGYDDDDGRAPLPRAPDSTSASTRSSPSPASGGRGDDGRRPRRRQTPPPPRRAPLPLRRAVAAAMTDSTSASTRFSPSLARGGLLSYGPRCHVGR
ncbi:hypothetical protein ACP4OV_017081 [Aristida adscensionis]